jgi:type VI secretion system protein ImpJ
MTRRPDPPPAIQWHEGMLLAPPHFQELERRIEALIGDRVADALPHFWGVRRLAHDRALLAQGIYRLVELDAVLPDGLVVRHDAARDALLEVALAPAADLAGADGLTIHVVVGRAALPGAAEGAARWRSVEGAPVADANTGEGAVSIPRLVPAARLVAGEGEAPGWSEQVVSLALARVVRLPDRWEATEFVPPTLIVPRGSPLGRACEEVVLHLRERADALAGRLASGGTMPPEAERNAVEAVRALVAGLPVLETLLASESAHPFRLYVALAQVVGLVAGIGVPVVPPPLPAYHHHDPLPAFAAARDFIDRMLARIVDSHARVPFTLQDDRFSLRLEPSWIGERLHVGVGPTLGGGLAEAARWVEQALIGNRRRLVALWERRVLGAPRRPVDAGALGLPARRDEIVFEIAPGGMISAEDALEIWNPVDRVAARRPREIVLYLPAAS